MATDRYLVVYISAEILIKKFQSLLFNTVFVPIIRHWWQMYFYATLGFLQLSFILNYYWRPYHSKLCCFFMFLMQGRYLLTALLEQKNNCSQFCCLWFCFFSHNIPIRVYGKIFYHITKEKQWSVKINSRTSCFSFLRSISCIFGRIFSRASVLSTDPLSFIAYVITSFLPNSCSLGRSFAHKN